MSCQRRQTNQTNFILINLLSFKVPTSDEAIACSLAPALGFQNEEVEDLRCVHHL